MELGDTYSGSGGAGGDYADGGLRDGQDPYNGSGWHRLGKRAEQSDQPPNYRKAGTVSAAGSPRGKDGWPLPKSLCMIPELYRVALAYGRNPLTGEPSPAGRWRCRNVVRWHRPNPPVGALGDKFRPATSDMVIACTSGKRYFDLDAVRNAGSPNTHAQQALDHALDQRIGVARLDRHQREQARADGTDHGAVHGHRGGCHALDEGKHAGIVGAALSAKANPGKQSRESPAEK